MKVYYRDDYTTIYHGDCREVLPRIDPVDLVLTDPPYGIQINKSARLSVSRGFKGETWDDKPIEIDLIRSLVFLGTRSIIWGGNYYNLPPCRGFLIWDKENDGRDFGECEFAWTNLDMVPRMFRQRSQNMDGGKVHPTQKPLAVMKWAMNFHKGSVLDPFMGSGSTLRAAKDLNRQAIGIEISEKYCEIAAKRLQQEVLNF